MTTPPNYASDATSLGESNARLEADGFTGQFAAREAGQVICFTCRAESPAETTTVEALRRTEGASDPDDMTAVAAIVCPSCSAKGTLVLKYGAVGTPEDADVLRLLEDGRSASSGGMQSDDA